MGEVLVAVRTPDPVLQRSLRQELPELAQALKQAGFEAALTTPAGRTLGTGSESQPESRAGERGPRGDGHGQSHTDGHSQGENHGDSRHQERRFETWLEQMED